MTTFPWTLDFPWALTYGLSFDSRTLVKILDEFESELKSVKPGKRIVVSPANKLDLPKKILFWIRKKNEWNFYHQVMLL